MSTGRRSLIEESLAAIDGLQTRLAVAEASKHEPIAIIGAGCRYPGGAETPEQLWELLRDGIDAVSEIPADRWDADAFYDENPRAPGKMVTRRAGFLRQVDQFDAGSFGISPREAQTLDPQQRLLLESALEALESAGIAPDSLGGSSTGVFVGITTSDYGTLVRAGGVENSDVYSATGSALNAAAGRLAFTFGFQGPTVAVDTACSSSLVAVHLACRALRNGEADLALAGGVNVVLSPDAMILFSKWGMLAPDGACKTFDAAADGFVRAEGCAVIALKRLSSALADGDPILALIRGTAVNQDGRSSGLTVPNGPAQQAVLRRALADAALSPLDIDYVEAHGTGTPLGDPIELEALGAVMGAGRSAATPLLVGSVKTNLGHTEASSGLAGMLKVVMALRHEAIPPHLHFTEPNPGVPWDRMHLRVPTTLSPWPRTERPRRAGVSSFGFSGTNAHVILEEAPAPRDAAPVADVAGMRVVPLSARSDAALRAAATRLLQDIERRPHVSFADRVTTLATGRAHLAHRAAIVCESDAQLADALRAIAAGESLPNVAHGVVPIGERLRVAMLCTGQGSQYAGMGRELYEREPVFREALDRCAAILAPHLDCALTSLLWGDDTARLDQTQYTQPALFALEWSLAELWRSWGVAPSVVLGHSVGEYVAACLAGVLSLDDALPLIAERGRLMQALPAGGAMTAIFAPSADVEAAVADAARAGACIAVAAINAAEHVVVSGDAADVAALAAPFADRGLRVQPLTVSHAFHSARLDPMLGALTTAARAVAHAAPRITLVSNLTGRAWPAGEAPAAEYWARHAREKVRFADSLVAAREAGCDVFLEIGPSPTLVSMAGQLLPADRVTLAHSLRRNRAEGAELCAALAALFVRGVAIQWTGVAASTSGRRTSLPTYPFQRERHWIDRPAPARAAPAADAHPLLGVAVRSPLPTAQFTGVLSATLVPMLAEHVVHGVALVPGAGFAEMALAAAHALRPVFPVRIEDLEIIAPLAVSDVLVDVHTAVEPLRDGTRMLAIRSSAPGEDWREHARARLVSAPSAVASAGDVAHGRADCTTTLDLDAYQARLVEAGLSYGPTFHGLRELHIGADVVVARVELPFAPHAPWLLHPALLDACFQSVGALLATTQPADDTVFLPVGMDVLTLDAPVRGAVWCVARRRPGAGDEATLRYDLAIEDDAGRPLAQLGGLQLRRASAQALRRALGVADIPVTTRVLRWQAIDLPTDAPRSLLLVADAGGVAEQLAVTAHAQGVPCEVIRNSDADSIVAMAGQRLVVDCRALDDNDDDMQAVRGAYLRLLALAQGMERAPDARFAVLTRGAHATAPGESASPVTAALVGLARTVGAERGDAATCARIDIDGGVSIEGAILLAALAESARRPELAIRGAALLAPELLELAPVAIVDAPDVSRASHAEAGDRVVLRIRERGVLDNLRLEREPRRAPGRGEIEIEVRAAGLNFRDVLNSLGMYPGDPGALGSECAGRVVAVGAGVAGFEPGDRVLAFATASFATHAIARADLTLALPAGTTFGDAVTLPNAYGTATFALRAANLQAGQSVLVHAATGGVGLAALRLARRMGARVIATAGSPVKRAIALREGATHAFDSRHVSFADDVRRVTDGRGVDVVINSLAGDLTDAGFRALAPDGCFVELGKTDLRSDAEIAALAPGCRYMVLDLGAEIAHDAAAVRDVLASLLADLSRGEIAALPWRAFSLRDAGDAFRHMAAAQHVGKIVIVPDGSEPTGLPPIRADGAYLVTGGLGGLGLATAHWLATHGAGTLVLVGRSAGDSAPADIAALEARGTRVLRVSANVGDDASLAQLGAQLAALDVPVRGVVHAAGTLADALLGDQDAARFDHVAAPKLGGALKLEALLATAPLDFFVLFSSASATLGSAGQANYAAANAALDALAARRRARGMPATSIAWGAWDRVGMAAGSDDATRRRWAEAGVAHMAPEAALDGMARAFAGGAAHTVVAAIDWQKLAARGGAWVRSLVGVAAPVREIGQLRRDALPQLDPAHRTAALAAWLRPQAAHVLGFRLEALDPAVPLAAVGLDSLMAVQLKSRVDADLGLSLPLASYMGGLSIDGLAARLADLVDGTHGTNAAPVATTASIDWEEGSL